MAILISFGFFGPAVAKSGRTPAEIKPLPRQFRHASPAFDASSPVP
jgi:hypothetical protein